MSDRQLSSQLPGPMGQAATDLCTFCPRLCSHACPVSLHSGRETLTPQAKMATLGRLRARLAQVAPTEGEPGPEASLPSWQAASPLYGCTGCGACTNPCLHKVEPARELLRGRADAEHASLGHPALDDLAHRHERRALAAADALAQDPELGTRRARPGEGAILPACLPRTHTTGTTGAHEAGEALSGPVRDGRAILRLADRITEQREARLESSLEPLPPLGIADVTHACAGYALYAAGLVEGFRLYAESFARQVEQYPLLVTSCSACTWLLRVGYPEHGVPLAPRVQHVTELLAPAAELLPIVQPLKRVSYHDPCHLGRRLGVYDEPRRLLERATPESDASPNGGGVTAITELAYHHDASRCCGAGGLLPFTEPEIARDMARARLAEAPHASASASNVEAAIVVTACPGCQHHLAESAEPHAAGPRVRSLVEVLEEATRPSRPR